jgi:membrane protease YdiL (CAAX protease family)
MQSSITVLPDQTINRSNWFARHPLVAYFSLAFVFTWLFFGPISLGQNGLGLLPYNLSDGVVFLFYMIATFGPLSAALVVTRMTGGRFSDVLRPVIQWRVNIVWYLIAIFSSLVIWLIAYAIPLAGLPFVLVANNVGMVTGLFVANLLVGLLLPSLGEEPGWRGFALPRLQEHYHPIAATVILGSLHSLWHLPALAVPTLLGPLTFENVIAFTLTAIAGTFIYVWVYNHSRGSVLPVIVLHAASNAASTTLSKLFLENNVALDGLPISYRWINVLAFGAAALLIVVVTRGRLGYNRVNQQ